MKANSGALQIKFQDGRATNQAVELSKPTRTRFRRLFFEKVLDRIGGPVLYKEGCALT